MGSDENKNQFKWGVKIVQERELEIIGGEKEVRTINIKNQVVQVKYQAKAGVGERKKKLAKPGPFVLDTAIDGPTLRGGS